LRRQERMGSKKEEEPILQWQDGIGNIPVFQDDGAPEWNPTISVGKDDVVWAMSVAVMVVLVIGSLCCLAKCNANMLTKRRKRKLRAAERRRSRKEKKMSEVKVEAAPAPATETRPREVVRAISKSNPQPHRARSPVKPQPRSRKDFIIDIIDSALGGEAGEAGGDLVNGLGSRPPSSESIDRADTRPRRASSGSVTLSLVFDMEADKPVFRRL